MPKLPLTGQVYKRLSLVLGAGLLLSLGANAWLISRKTPSQGGNLPETLASAVVKPVQAEEIYPLFFCPCCGQPLDKNNICCGAAEERIAYIDSLVAAKISKDETILAYVKKYGSDSFVDKNKQKEFREELVKLAPGDRPVISLTPDFYDFGDVRQKEGEVFTSFELKNEGESDLVIDRLETSCGCTFASIVFEGEEGPQFTMPGMGYENPTDWKVSIPPGEQAQLKVMYDPAVHQDFRGAATRAVSIFSNDPIDLEKKVTIELNQID